MTTVERACLKVTSEGLKGYVPVQVMKDGDGWIGTCLPLELVAQGDTQQEATEAIYEAIDMFLEDVMKEKSLERVLVQELRWMKIEKEVKIPTYELPPSIIQRRMIGPITAPA